MRNDLSPDLPRALALSAAYEMFPSGGTILLAVSGGRDSMALLHWSASLSAVLPIHLAVGHFHHGMRGESADRDARRVESWCRDHQIPFYMDRGAVYQEAARRGLGVEEAGRLLRYAFLERTAQAIGALRIATAHNADDNAETLLLNLVRGSGLQGLTGIPPVRGRVVRPFLTTSRREIDSYVARYAIPYGEDETNGDDTYARNRIRHQVTPVLFSLNPRYLENVSSAIHHLREDNSCLQQMAEALLSQAEFGPGSAVLPVSCLRSAPTPISVRAVRSLMDRVTGSSQYGERHLRGVLDLARSKDPSARLSLPHGLTVRRVYETLLFTTQEEEGPWTPVPLSEGENQVGNWTLTVTGAFPGLLARPRQIGDRIRLPGQAEKSLKKLMIEKKIPRHLRDGLPIAADAFGPVAVPLLGENSDHPRFGRVRIAFHPRSPAEPYHTAAPIQDLSPDSKMKRRND